MSLPRQPSADQPAADGHPHDDERFGDGAPLDAESVKRLAEIDDRLAGFAETGIDPDAANAEFTPELARRLDTLLLLRLVAADASRPTSPLSIGKFRVIRKIGEGGFAEVYEVIDTKLVRREALKIARPEVLLHSGKTNRFLREAKLAARVSHPNIVVIHEVGEHEGLPYIAQELCGESLGAWLDRHPGPVAPSIAARIVRAIAEAVHAAHAVGVLHRDIKPGNVLLVPSPDGPLPTDDRPESRSGTAPALAGQDVKLGDFGLSVSIFDPDPEFPAAAPTEVGTVLGTPEWMAPEQVDTSLGPIDVRTDVHALGLVLDRLLTGRCVNASPLREDVRRRILEVEPPPSDRVVPGIHADLVAVCGKCLAKRPADRYSSAAEVAVDLSRFLDGRPTIARPLAPTQRAVRWLRRNPTLAGAMAAALAAVLLGGFAIEERARRIAREAAVAEIDADNRREAAERAATRDLRRAFESYRNGDAAGAVDDLWKSAAADAALADSIAGGWLLARTHGERAILIDRGEKASSGGEDALQIHSIALSPNADRLAAGVADGTVVLLPLAPDGTPAGAPIEIDAGHEINQVVFSPDGAVLATVGKLLRTAGAPVASAAKETKNPADVGRVRLWNVADGSLRRDVAIGGQEVYSLSFSPSGERIAWGGADRVIHVAGPDEGGPQAADEVRPFDFPGAVLDAEADIELLRFLDERRVLVAIHERVCLVDLATGWIERSFVGEQGDVQAFSLSPDGTRLVVGGWFEHLVRVWDFASGTLEFEIDGATQWIQGCGFSPDGRQIVSGCKDGVIRVYDARSRDPVEELVGHLDRIWTVLYHPSGRILSSGGDGTVRIWDPAVGPTMRGATTIAVPEITSVESIADLGDGRGLLVPRTGVPVLVDTGGKIEKVDGIGVTKTYGTAFHRASRRCAIADQGGLSVFRYPGDGMPVEPRRLTSDPCSSVTWNERGWLFAGTEDEKGANRCYAWPPDLGAPSCIDEGYAEDVDSIAISGGRRPRLALATGAVIWIHDLDPDGAPVPGSGRRLVDLIDETGMRLRLAWSPDGTRLAVGSLGGETLILDADTGDIVVDIGPFLQPVRGIVWADNGRSLVVAAEHCIRLIDSSTGVTLDDIRPKWAVTDITVIAGHDGHVRLAVTGNRSSHHRRTSAATERGSADGLCLFLDVGRRLPADVPRGQ